MRTKRVAGIFLIFVLGIAAAIGSIRLAQKSRYSGETSLARIINSLVAHPSFTSATQIQFPPTPSAGKSPAAIIALAQASYVRLDIRGVILSNQKGGGSGVRVSDNLILSCFHLLQSHAVTEMNGEILEIQSIDPPNDLALFITEQKKHVTVKLATSVTLGEQLIGYSNACGKDGFLRTYFVAKVDDAHGIIFLDHFAFPGESGSGLFNLKGELVGIISNLEIVNVGEDRIPTDGVAVSYAAIARFLKNAQ